MTIGKTDIRIIKGSPILKKNIVTSTHLDIFPLVLEVDPGVRVAPDQDGEDEGAQRGRDQHDHQAEQALVACGHECTVVQPKNNGK